MMILAVDTSGSVCTAAVLKNEKIVTEVYSDLKRTHSEELAPMIDYCISRAGISIKDVDMFCCAKGPGSYTGIRIGAAMIKAFAQASGRPAVGVNTLDALAQNLTDTRDTICPMIDARRGEVYTAVYECGRRITDYMAVPIDEVLASLKGKNAVFLGDASVNYRHKIILESDGFRIAHFGAVLQRAGSVGIAALRIFEKEEFTDSFRLEPFYLRETQAERELKKKGGMNGG